MNRIVRRLKNDYIRVCIPVFLFAILLMMVAFAVPSEDVGLGFGQIHELNDLWKVTVSGSQMAEQSLPQNLEVASDEVVHLSRSLPEDFKYGQTIRFRSSMHDFRVLLDGQVLYDNTAVKRSSFPHSAEASVWVLVDVEPDSQGKELELVMSSSVPAMTGRINGVYYGARGDLIAELFSRQPSLVLVTLFVFAAAFFLFLMGMAVNLKGVVRMNYLSLFALCVGIWLVSEMDILQLFVSNSYIVGTVSYLTLPVAAILFILFIKEAALEKYSRFMNAYAGTFGIYLLISMVLQLFLGRDYIVTWPVFIVMLQVLMVAVFGLLTVEAVGGSVIALKYILFIALLVVTSVAETIMFLTGNFMSVSSLSNIGVGVFLFLLMLDTLNYLNQILMKEGEAKYLREIAYRDSLTGGLNRAAFEKEVDRLLGKKSGEPFRLTMFDLNNLKGINDQLGHEYGDRALSDFHRALNDAFGLEASCYRVGGDEFMVIQYDVDEKLYEDALDNLIDKTRLQGKNRGYSCNTAYGSDIYDYGQSFGEFKHHVDMKMYSNKVRIKAGDIS